MRCLIPIVACLGASLLPWPSISRAARPPQTDGEPSPSERKTLFAKMIENQHVNDRALEIYERVERRELRPHAGDVPADEDRTYRIVPTGTGTVRVQTQDHGRAVPPAEYRKQMTDLVQALEAVLDSKNPRSRDDFAKRDRRTRERSEIIDATREAYTATWLGREQRASHVLLKFRLDPNPAYKAHTRAMEFMSHTRATIWIDEKSSNLVQLEGEVVSDVSFGAGIGKVYRGGKLFMRQDEVEPGIWLPTFYQTDFTGRKIFFLFETHERIITTAYRKIGPPAQALAEIKRELASTGGRTP